MPQTKFKVGETIKNRNTTTTRLVEDIDEEFYYWRWKKEEELQRFRHRDAEARYRKLTKLEKVLK